MVFRPTWCWLAWFLFPPPPPPPLPVVVPILPVVQILLLPTMGQAAVAAWVSVLGSLLLHLHPHLHLPFRQLNGTR